MNTWEQLLEHQVLQAHFERFLVRHAILHRGFDGAPLGREERDFHHDKREVCAVAKLVLADVCVWRLMKENAWKEEDVLRISSPW